MHHLLGSVQLQNPIRLQSPIYLDGAQRPQPRRGQPGFGENPDRPDDPAREDTVILVRVRKPPSPPGVPDLPELPARALKEEDSQDGDVHGHMQRLLGSVQLRTTSPWKRIDNS